MRAAPPSTHVAATSLDASTRRAPVVSEGHPAASSTSARASRRYELDWLRALAVFGLIPFHAAVVFTTGVGDYVKNGQTSVYMNTLAAFITLWGIPLLFFVAGAAASFALHIRTTMQYVGERITRLAIPLIFGVLAIVPLQVYIGTLGQPGPHRSYLGFYAQYLQMWLGILHGVFPANANVWIGHLWFIPPLLLYSLLALPLFRFLQRDAGQRFTDVVANMCAGWGALVVLSLPLGVVELAAQSAMSTMSSFGSQLPGDWVAFCAYLLFFLYGYLIYSDERIVGAIRNQAPAALALGATIWLALQALRLTNHTPAPSDHAAYGALTVLVGCTSALWVLAVVGLGMRFLSRGNRLVRYLTKATYPVYVLHMPVLTLVAFYVVRWDANLVLKFLTIIVSTLCLTLLLYDLMIKRVEPLRFLFGMRVRGRAERREGERAHSGEVRVPAH